MDSPEAPIQAHGGFIKSDEERARVDSELKSLKSAIQFLLLQVVTMQAEIVELRQRKRDRE